MSDDVTFVMEYFSVDEDRATELVSNGLNVNMLRGNYNLVHKELGDFVDSTFKDVNKLSNDIGQQSDQIKENLKKSME